MSLAAESPSPSMSSLSDDGDFADLLAAELELSSTSHGDPSASPASHDDEEGEEDVVVEADAVEQGSSKRRRVEEQQQDRRTAMMPDEDAIAGSFKDAQIKLCPPHPGYCFGLCTKCGKIQDEEDVSGVHFGYIHKSLRLGTSEMDRLRGAEVKNLLRKRKLGLILDLDHTLINSTRLHDISAAEMDMGILTAASKGLAEAQRKPDSDGEISLFCCEPTPLWF